jgi:hypothetical protein
MLNRSVVYFVQGLHGYKIGITNSLPKRMSTFKTANPHIRLISHTRFLQREDAVWLERALHIKYAHLRISGEWFDLGPHEVNEVMEILKGRKKSPVREQKVNQALKSIFWWSIIGTFVSLAIMALIVTVLN